ncbi:MAG: HAD-IA family hydrolase [Bacteroidales bacterium]|nr:HAD-IA family hydrolase [Bacteroidales bacterium]
MKTQDKTIIFDFDGTIADTLETIARLYNAIAADYNCKEISYADKERFRSMNTQKFLHECGIPLIKLPKLSIKIKKELKNEIKNIKPFPGIIEVLHRLKKEGFKLGVLSSNSVTNINLFLEHNTLENIFDFVHSGKNIFGKDKTLLSLLFKYKIDRNNVIYIGDETRDIDALKRIKIPIVAVSHGFNSREILKTKSPDYLVDNPEELLEVLLSI